MDAGGCRVPGQPWLVQAAWFDVTTAPPGAGLAAAVALALVAELPMSALCAAIAWHSRPLDPAQPRP